MRWAFCVLPSHQMEMELIHVEGPFSIQFFMHPLPKPYVLRTNLLNYGSRVLAPLEAEGKIVIWEFENDRGCVLTSNSTSSSWKWKEIARMPPTKYHHLKAISGHFPNGLTAYW
jgi:hypothetical protein